MLTNVRMTIYCLFRHLRECLRLSESRGLDYCRVIDFVFHKERLMSESLKVKFYNEMKIKKVGMLRWRRKSWILHEGIYVDKISFHTDEFIENYQKIL